MIAAIILAALGGLWLGYRTGVVRAPVRTSDDAAHRIYEADHARWRADNEAYRWKRRALRLGWRRDGKRWDR